MTNRENLYCFLGLIYKVEVDEPMLELLKTMVFPSETGEREMDEGYRLLERFLEDFGADPISQLAKDFGRVFLGSGMYEESVVNFFEMLDKGPRIIR